LDKGGLVREENEGTKGEELLKAASGGSDSVLVVAESDQETIVMEVCAACAVFAEAEQGVD
jgi:hypothetical protein